VTFSVRTIAEIRDDLLAYWQGEYAANDEVLLVSPGSDAYILAAMIAVVQNACDVQARQVARDILPDQASDEAIARFGYVYGIARLPGVAARLTAQVTGAAPATVYSIPAGTQMSWTDGTLYDVTNTSVTTDGSSHATINLVATTVGSETTRNVSDTLTFLSAPSGLNPTAPVTAVTTAGDDAETFQEWAQRIIARLRERPASGNRSDWATWVQNYTALDIRNVYVYPLVQPGTDAPLTLGCVTVVPVGPPQGDSVTNTRILGGVAGATLTEVKEYIEGTRTASGIVTSSGTQLRPVTMAEEDYTVDAIDTVTQLVDVRITVTSANAFPFTFSPPTIDGTSTATSLVLVGDYTTGSTNLEDVAVLVNVGTSAYRGGYYRVVLPAGTFGGGNTTFNLTSTPLPAAPTGTARPAPGNWSDIRTAVFDYFDSLGPGDVAPAARYPSEDTGARATVYPSAVAAVIMGVPGVLAVNLISPAANVTPAAKQVVTLSTLAVTKI
jgi:uncharacterized phage protein gp47/JayE